MRIALVIIATAGILAVTALFLNIGVRVGLSGPQRNTLGYYKNVVQLQCDAAAAIVVNATNLRHDRGRVQALEDCESAVASGLPNLIQQTQARIAALQAFVVPSNTTYITQMARTMVEALLPATGVVTQRAAGALSYQSMPLFSYNVKSIRVGTQELAYVEIPASPGSLIQVSMNMTLAFELSANPPLGGGLAGTRSDTILDDQRLKIQSTPTELMLYRRYGNLGFEGVVPLAVGDYIGVTRTVEMNF